MKEKLINEIVTMMAPMLDAIQDDALMRTLTICLDRVEIKEKEAEVATETANNEHYIKTFLMVKQLAGRQQTTIKQYEYELKRFVDLTGCNVARCDTNLIRKYLYDYQQRASNTACENIRRVLSSFFSFMMDEGYIAKNPMRPITPIKKGTKIKKQFSDYQIEQLRDACKDAREIALIDLLLSTGLRIHEVPQIKLSDIYWEERRVLIHGKGDKDRLVPFSPRAEKHMRDYLATRPQQSNYLFCRTKAPYDQQASKDMIAGMFDKIRNRAGLSEITIHAIRRWVATSMSERGADPVVIQSILGHSSFSTTQKHYLNTNLNRISQVHDTCAV